jgi:hypothetical protein
LDTSQELALVRRVERKTLVAYKPLRELGIESFPIEG